jgi:hypothetical protein
VGWDQRSIQVVLGLLARTRTRRVEGDGSDMRGDDIFERQSRRSIVSVAERALDTLRRGDAQRSAGSSDLVGHASVQGSAGGPSA